MLGNLARTLELKSEIGTLRTELRIEILRGHRQLSLASLVDVVIHRVDEFSASNQTDDQTLVVARVR